MVADRENARYLPGISFPTNLIACPDLAECLGDARDILLAVPSHGLRETLMAIHPLLDSQSRICWATKGFELHSGKLPHQVAAEILGSDRPVAVLSGPTFAKEVGAGLPTAMTVAANDEDFAQSLAVALSGDKFRAYTSDDMIGVEVGGAVKNVLAIGAGISDGLGFGANTRVALITRGLVEMTRKRTRENLLQTLCEPCDYCEGRGFVLSRSSVAFKVLREVRNDLPRFSSRRIAISVNPHVAEQLLRDGSSAVVKLGEDLGREIEIRARPGIHQEQFEVLALDTGPPVSIPLRWLDGPGEKKEKGKGTSLIVLWVARLL